MSKWKQHWTQESLRRSPEYDASVRKAYGKKRIDLVKHNWKMDQIARLKKERAITARQSARSMGESAA